MSILSFPLSRTFAVALVLALHPLGTRAQTVDRDSSHAKADTVSIAALRTPPKARKHLEQARQAAIAGREPDYQRELAAALTIDPRFSEAYVLRASHEVVDQDYAAAIEDTLTAQRFDPAAPWATIIHASVCNQLRRYDEAFTLLEGLRPAEADTWQAAYEMTRSAVGRGNTDSALHWSALALTVVPVSRADEAVLLRANALQMAHRWQEAAAQLQTYLNSPRPQPKHIDVLRVLDRVQRLARDEKPAEVAELTQQQL